MSQAIAFTLPILPGKTETDRSVMRSCWNGRRLRDPAGSGMAASDQPHDRWFREYVLDVHGVDLAESFPPPEQVLDYRA